jgi:transcriptional regulator with XRE-family HTH domain
MNHSSIGPKPYAELGEKLKALRTSSRESLAEVSGAVEIDEHILERFETGMDRPDEEILNLLINHYHLNDHIATQLWELAGYSARPDDSDYIEEAMAAAKQLVMVLATDGRTVYTDGVSVDCNNKGLTMSFTQSVPQNNSFVVSRLGMSYESATEVLKALGIALTYAKYAQAHPMLPPGKTK